MLMMGGRSRRGIWRRPSTGSIEEVEVGQLIRLDKKPLRERREREIRGVEQEATPRDEGRSFEAPVLGGGSRAGED